MAYIVRMLKSPALWILLITIAVIAAMMAMRPEPPRVAPQERSWPVQTRTIAPQSLSPQLRLLGRVESPFTSTLTAGISATVDQVPVLEGALVAQNQLLVALDAQEATLLLRQAEADRGNLQAQINQERNRADFDRQTLAQQETLVAAAKRTLEREQRLTQSNLTSELRLDEARTNLASAELSLINQRLVVANQDARMDALKAQLARAEALVDQARLDLSRAEVRAPFPGVLTAVEASPGERMRIGDPILTLYAADSLEVRAQLPQRWLPQIRSVLAQEKQLDASAISGDSSYELALARLAGRVNPGAGGVDALFRFAGDAAAIAMAETGGLALGRSLDIILDLPPVDNVISLPVSALYGTNQIFRVVDGRLQGVFVELRGDRFTEAGQQILVYSSELKDGDQVITTQLPNAVSGLRVDVRTAAPAEEDRGS